jgi:hypothetical protein
MHTGERWGEGQLLAYCHKINDALRAIGHDPQFGHRRGQLAGHASGLPRRIARHRLSHGRGRCHRRLHPRGGLSYAATVARLTAGATAVQPASGLRPQTLFVPLRPALELQNHIAQNVASLQT